MKSLNITILLVCACFGTLLADAVKPFHFSLKCKELKLLKIIILQDASVHINGYDGSELLITGKNDTSTGPINGYHDISALAAQIHKSTSADFAPRIIENNGMIEMILQTTDANDITIQLPKRTHFSLQFVSHLPKSMLSLTGLYGELMISADVPSVFINNISGPLSLTSAGINLKKVINISHVRWNKAGHDNSPLLFIASLNADVNLCVPPGLKASLNLKATHNRVYSDLPSHQLNYESSKNGDLAVKLNGGGTQVFITTEYGNILLKKEL